MLSFRSYFLLSFAFPVFLLFYSIYLRKYFYGSVIYFSKSKSAFLGLGNMALALVLLFAKLVQFIFLGKLRLREIERLNMRARDAVIESCLAMTVFRDEFNSKFMALFTMLLFLKIFHWLMQDRIELVEEQPIIPFTTHVRLVGLMNFLLLCDMTLIYTCVSRTIKNGPSMFILFAFEFMVLVISLISYSVKYIFVLVDIMYDHHWEPKGMLSFYNELITDFLQLVTYMIFFVYVHAFFSLPLHIVRDIYLTVLKFNKRLGDFIRYRRVINTMNELFSDATTEELNSSDHICIVCREEMSSAKKLNCGHIFHVICLQGWLKRQLSCPTCRASIDVPDAHGGRNGMLVTFRSVREFVDRVTRRMRNNHYRVNEAHERRQQMQGDNPVLGPAARVMTSTHSYRLWNRMNTSRSETVNSCNGVTDFGFKNTDAAVREDWKESVRMSECHLTPEQIYMFNVRMQALMEKASRSGVNEDRNGE